MMNPHGLPAGALALYQSAPYECSYLANKQARSQVVTPAEHMTPSIYANLLRHGFRRSGLFVYRPKCGHCKACVSIRVNTHDFKFSTNQSRILKRHSQLKARVLPLRFDDDQFALYIRYQEKVHGENLPLSEHQQQYTQFLIRSLVDSAAIEYRDTKNQIKLVAICDFSDDGISAVYTFYDPDDKSSLGTFSILRQIEMCKQYGLPWLYLGHWVKSCPRMQYKLRFQPLEFFINNCWQDC